MNRAFTLKQVIAIAAIMAVSAVTLVPIVAAQGSSDPKSRYLGQLQQLGLRINAYAFDWDDHLPQAMFRRPDSGAWAVGVLTPSPADCIATAPWNTPARIAASQTQWRNSTAAYTPYPSTALPGAPEYRVPGDVYNGTPNITNPTMNGLLHCYSLSAVATPNILPLVWSGFGSTNLVGRAISNPQLNCLNAPDCLFNPSGPPSSSSSGNEASTYAQDPVTTTWIYGHQGPMISTDLTLHLRPSGTKIAPSQVEWPNVNVDPWASVTTTGVPQTMWTCGPGHTAANPVMGVVGHGNYPCYFRPDRTE